MRVTKVSAILLVVFLCAVSAGAQAVRAPVRILVIGEDNPPSRDAADRIRGRVGSSSRYSLTTKMTNADITFGVMCVNTLKGDWDALACASSVSYWPGGDGSLPVSLTRYIATGPIDYVANGLFDDFVQSTSDEKLSERELEFKNHMATSWLDGFKAGLEAGRSEGCKASPQPKKRP